MRHTKLPVLHVPRLHVTPVDDLRDHITVGAAQCWCQPRLQRVHGGILVIHNSADGRELVEEHGLQ